MVSFWPFSSGGNRIQDLKAPQLAEAALKSMQKSGRTAYSLRLIYRTLELDPFHPHALLILSELFRGKYMGAKPKGDEALSGIIIEYAMDRKNVLPAEQKRHFDKARLDLMTQWGFVTSRGTESEVDHIGYMTYINEQLGKFQSVTNGFLIAMAKLGIQAGVYDPGKNTPSRAYQDWLRTDASTLRH